MNFKNKNFIVISTLTILVIILYIALTGLNSYFGSTIDWANQHTVFPEYFRKLFYSDFNLFPNFALNYGGGQNIYNISYYGYLSPYTILSYLFPFIKMVNFLTITLLIAVIASGFLVYKWLISNNYSHRISFTVSVLFTLSGPLLFHVHRHIMFMNYMPFLILGLMGIDNYFKNNQKYLIVLSSFLIIMVSYFFSISCFLVFVIYAIYKYIEKEGVISLKTFLKEGINFSLLIILGILMASIILIPNIFTILAGRTSELKTDYSLLYLLKPFLNIDNFLYTSHGSGYTSVILFGLFSCFFIKDKKYKFLNISMLVIMCVPIFSYVLNGGLYIKDKVFIPFIPLFAFIIARFLKEYENNSFDKRNFTIIGTIGVIFIIFGQATNNYVYYLYLTEFIITTIVFIYFIKRKKTVFYVMLCITAFIICFINNKKETYISYDTYNEAFSSEDVKLVEETLKKDNSFYRFNHLVKDNYLAMNNIIDVRYLKNSIYSSTYNGDYRSMYNNILGNANPYPNSFITTESNNIFSEIFFSVKYILSDNNAPIGYEKINSIGSKAIYRNDSVLPIMYATSNLMKSKTFDKLSFFEKQEAILKNVIINNNMVPDDKTNNYFSSDLFSYEVSLNDFSYNKDFISVINNNKVIEVDTKRQTGMILNLRENMKNKILLIRFKMNSISDNSLLDNIISINNTTNRLTKLDLVYHNNNYEFVYIISSSDDLNKLYITLEKSHYEISNLEMFTLDYDSINNIKDTVDEFVIDDKKSKNGVYIGNIKVRKDGYFVTSIPYDNGFTVYIDGKKTEIEKVNTAFLGFRINEGNHNIKIVYKTKGFDLALSMSVLGISIFFIVVLNDKRKKLV